MTSSGAEDRSSNAAWDYETDVVICGSGAGGLSAAIFATKKDLRVLVCEKTAQLGGTTARSGGIIWIPCSAQAKAAGIDDSPEKARLYLQHELKNDFRADVVDAYLATGPEALATLETGTDVKYVLNPWPDYHPTQPGGVMAGRTLNPVAFDGRILGRDFALVAPPIKRTMLFGGMSVGLAAVNDFLHPFASFRAFRNVLGQLTRYATDRLRFPRGTHIWNGNALVARMLNTLRRTKAVIWVNSPLVELISEADRIVGAIIARDGARIRVRATQGVILATGGFPRNAEMRKEFGGEQFPHHHTIAYEANVGDGIAAARAVGASVDTDLASPGFWQPSSAMRGPDGQERTIFYGYLDRGYPGCIAVDENGRRFVNESDSYHDIGLAMFANGAGKGKRFYLVCDRNFIWKRGLGYVRPYTPSLRSYVKSGYLIVADTPAKLARKIGIDPDNFAKTVADHNAYAATGVDLEFGRGASAYNRLYGDPTLKPNPNLAPIKKAPFIALQIYPGTIGTAMGMKTNADAQVLDKAGQPIAGLYACGNDLASVMRGHYPGGGITIGPAIVFAFRAINKVVEAASGESAR